MTDPVEVLRELRKDGRLHARQCDAIDAVLSALEEAQGAALKWEALSKTHSQFRERAEQEAERLRESLIALTLAADDVLRGWDAKCKLVAGVTGMGHNILIEDAGRYTSLTMWERVRRTVESARATLSPEQPK